ncbi:MAG: hypothetical protein Q7T01_00320 [bacterium]|nr:hypothetical protein [bacterium]
MILLLLSCLGAVFVVSSLFQTLAVNRGKRPSAFAALWRFPLIAASLGAPVVFEDAVTTSDAAYSALGTIVHVEDDTLTPLGIVGWCPDGCVQVPNEMTSWLRYSSSPDLWEVTIQPMDAVALVRRHRKIMNVASPVSKKLIQQRVNGDLGMLWKQYAAAHANELGSSCWYHTHLQAMHDELQKLATSNGHAFRILSIRAICR